MAVVEEVEDDEVDDSVPMAAPCRKDLLLFSSLSLAKAFESVELRLFWSTLKPVGEKIGQQKIKHFNLNLPLLFLDLLALTTKKTTKIAKTNNKTPATKK